MVLQNKFKARASRRYNKTHGSATDGAGSSKNAQRRKQIPTEAGEPQDVDGYASDHSSADSASDEEEDPNFPSLAKASEAPKAVTPEIAEDPSNPASGKYARRKLGESRLAMMERLEAAKDPRLEAEVEPEPEVDLSALMAKVAALGPSGASQAGITQEIARHRAAHETVSDVEQDIDHSLSYLHDKERQRQIAKGRGGAEETTKPITVEHVDLNSEDMEAMKKDKEKAEAVRALKARFQGRGLGERERKDKASTAPSLTIGPHKTSVSSGSSNGTASTSKAKPLSSALDTEIDKTLRNQRQNGAKGDSGSAKSARSSFSTSFGRARGNSASSKSTLSGSSTPSPPTTTDGIDGFLRSLNDRSVFGERDQSIFPLRSGSTSPHNANRCPPTSAHASYQHYRQLNPQAQTIHSRPGELGRMENFLDAMLG